jgi:hypothetical protein
MKTLVAAGLVMAAIVVDGVTARAHDETNILNMQRWARAVVAHQPGVPDGALTVIWALTPGDRQFIGDRVKDFVLHFDRSVPGRTGEEHTLVGLAQDLATTMTAKDFLERAAVLHADAVMFDRRAPTAPAMPRPRPGMALVGSRAGEVVVSSTDPSTYGGAFAQPTDPAFVTTVDGEVRGRAAQNWNWPFARLLLDQLRPGEADAFVSLWYHATTALLFKRGELAEVKAQLSHADRQLPDDARIAFDNGCLAEGMGMNIIQQVAGDQVRIPSAATSNAQALLSFQHALAIDSHFVEARVRAARLLELAGHFAEANDQIHVALADKPSDKATLFYAHLFGARAAAALGRDEEADSHVRAALDLFPKADSAILAASQAAFHRADAGRAQYRLSELAGRSDVADVSEPSVDPWRDYMFGVGRVVEPLLQDLWHTLPARDPR